MKSEIETPEENSTEITKDESNEMTDAKVTPAEQKEWKAKILGINNRKLLDYICTVARARMDIGQADHQVGKKETKGKDGLSSYSPPPDSMKPMFPTESDNMDEN